MKFLTNLDLQKNQIWNASFQKLAQHPTIDNFDGRMYYNTVEKKVYIYNSDSATWTELNVNLVGASGEITLLNNGTTTTIGLESTGVSSGTYGSTTAIPTFTVDSKGRITSASTVSVGTTLNVSGDAGTDGISLLSDTLNIAGGTGLSSSVTNNSITINLDNTTVTSGSYGSATAAPTFTVNSQGQLTAAGTVTITPAFSSITGTPTTISGYGITDAQPLDADLTAIAAITGTGILKRTASNTWSVETNNLQDVTGRGATTSTAISITNTTNSTSATSGALTVSGGVGISKNLYVGENLTVDGNLTVNGTTTTINSVTVTVDDPIFVLGGNETPTTDDSLDKGIEFKWHNGTSAKLGFFGFDRSTGRFSFVPDATDTSGVISGASGDIQATNFYGSLVGNADTATKLASARTISISTDATGSATFDGSANATIALTLADSGVTAGTYGSSTAIPTFTVDSKGRITSAGTASVATTLNISGDSGTDGVSLLSETLNITGGVGLTSAVTANTVTINLDNTSVSAGSYGSSTSIPTFTVDAQGRLTSAGTVSVATNLNIAGDTGTGNAVALLTETLTISGGTGLTSVATTDTITINLDNTAVTPGSYGTATSAPTFTVDAQGRLTSAGTVTITPAWSSVTNKPTNIAYKYYQQLSTSATSYVITHNLGTSDITVTVREVAGNKAIVYTDVEVTSDNTITLYFATAPTANQYSVTVIG